MKEVTGKNFSEFVNEHIFIPLGIKEWNWRNCKDGICFGATGLCLRITDLLKIGQLVLNDGSYENKQIIASDVMEEIKKVQVPTNIINWHYLSPVFPRWAYGYGLWLTDDGTCFADGKRGQFIFIQPKCKRIIVVFSQVASENMRQVVNCMDVLKG